MQLANKLISPLLATSVSATQEITMHQRTKLLIAAITLSIISSLTGCGSEGSGDQVNNSSPASTKKLSELIVSDNFDWKMQHELLTNIQLVSNFSYIEGEPAQLSGRFLMTVYGIDQHGIRHQDPALRGMSDSFGKFLLALSAPDHWQAIEIHAQRPFVDCIAQLDHQYIGDNFKMGCDLYMGFDQ
jgi:hypothetical protein